MQRTNAVFLVALGVLSLCCPAESADKPYTPRVAAASDEAAKALKRFRVPAGVEARVWAAEPLLANPVSFCFDEKGRCYVAETFRLHRGVTDNRGHMNWLDDDLASRTVADRVAMYRKYLKDQFKSYETDHDRVRLVEDSKGTGAADRATVFADGFRNAADGIGSGVLARKGNVYYTCIPDLWLLRDTKGDGKADVRRSLATGFGIHVAFIGHDMHGLRMGPDGLLYFSIGDRGLNVKTKEGTTLFYPDTGAVLRCEPDGSNLEVVHSGLRNPQELAFDVHGDLFTVDNNSDSGDRARLVQIVEGGDSGWRTGYQYGSDFSDRASWNAEKIWHLPNPEQPAFVVPPLAHITSGPSGLCYNYGATALPARYADHFFVCDFRGSAGGSGVYSFAVKPKGASFEVADGHQFIWSLLATDCDFGPDGGFYISDWVEGWGLTGKGRIYRFADKEATKSPAVAEVKKYLAEGMERRPAADLVKLLGHADQRVRQEAQFALADRGADSIPLLAKAAKEQKNQLARLHAVWGLGQLGRRGAKVQESLKPLLADSDAEVRRQAARAIGWLKETEARDLVPLLKDAEPRVRFQAALSLARPGVRFSGTDSETAWDALVRLLEDNADRDAYMRHAAARAMAGYPGQKLVSAAKHPSPSVRLAAVLALRQGKGEVAWPFLDDAEPRVAVEAARVLHDVRADDPLAGQPLADRLNRPNMPDAFVLRALNAHFRLGQSENAAALAAFATRTGSSEKMRVEALRLLGLWAKPPRRDRVTGLTQSLAGRDAKVAAGALKQSLGGIFAGPNAVRQEAAKVAAALGVKEVAPVLVAAAGDAKRPAAVRVEALRALEALKDGSLDGAMRAALKDPEPRLRGEGRRLLAHARPDEALPEIVRALEGGQTVERQGAFAVLGEMKGPRVEAELAKWLDLLLAGQVPAEVRLDLLEAAGRHPAHKEKVQRYEASGAKDDPLRSYRDALVGGDAESGRRIFFSKAEVSCLRCHKVQGTGGDVGPDLAGIGTRQKRDYLLESIVIPNKQIAKGFDTLVLTLKNGKGRIGVLKSEDAREVRLMTPEGQLLIVPKNDIDERETGKSAMPEDLIKHLSRSEIRDLVEFLAGLKEGGAAGSR